MAYVLSKQNRRDLDKSARAMAAARATDVLAELEREASARRREVAAATSAGDQIAEFAASTGAPGGSCAPLIDDAGAAEYARGFLDAAAGHTGRGD